MNIPSTYPAWPINGEMITGLLSPEISEKIIYPKSLIEQVKKKWIIDGSNINEIFEAFEIKKQIFLEKLKQQFDLLCFIIRIPDSITHHPNLRIKITKENIKKGYKKIDEFIGILLDNGDFDNLFIISDHGLKLYKNEFNIKRFLEKEKILFYNNDPISKFLSILIKVSGFINPKFFDTTYFHNRIKKSLEKLFKSFLYRSKSRKAVRFIHFFSNYGGIYLGEKEKKFKGKLKQILLKNKIIEQIIEYDSKNLPDFIIILNKKYLFSTKSSLFIVNRSYSYNHSDKGIFMAIGKNIIKGRKNEVSYLHFAPTLLKLFNIEKPDYMKGEPLNILK